MKTIQAKARVQLTVEVDSGGAWNEDCEIGQLYKQAAESGRERLISALGLGGERCCFKIVGEPKVVGIMTERE